MDKHKQDYLPERLAHLGKCLEAIRRPKKDVNWIPSLRVNLKGLHQALKALPKKERQIIEKFLGLTGGPNHSAQLSNHDLKDIAYINMRTTALTTLRKLFELDYMIQYDQNLAWVVEHLAKKINIGSLPLSDFESVKYLMAFAIFL